MTSIQISLLISGLALLISLWARFEGFVTNRRSRIVDRLKRLGECIDLATELICQAENYESLLEKVKANPNIPESDTKKNENWEKMMQSISNVKQVTQAFIDSAHQDLKDFKRGKRVKLSQIEIEAFLAEFQSIKTRHRHLFLQFEKLVAENEILQAENEELKSKLITFSKKWIEQEVDYEKIKKTDVGL